MLFCSLQQPYASKSLEDLDQVRLQMIWAFSRFTDLGNAEGNAQFMRICDDQNICSESAPLENQKLPVMCHVSSQGAQLLNEFNCLDVAGHLV